MSFKAIVNINIMVPVEVELNTDDGGVMIRTTRAPFIMPMSINLGAPPMDADLKQKIDQSIYKVIIDECAKIISMPEGSKLVWAQRETDNGPTN